MKKGTEAKVKFKMLERALKLDTWQVKGLLTSLWDFAAVNAQAGNVGAYSNYEIAIGIGFSGDIEPVIAALVETKWLDEDEEHRLVIHHWPEHCEDSIHVSLARKRMFFSDGSTPKLAKLSKRERPSAEAAYRDLEPPRSAMKCREVIKTAENRLPVPAPCHASPAPKPLPKPAPQESGKLAAGVFALVSEETLRDPTQLQSWFEKATSRRKPVVHDNEHNRLMVFAAAERAIGESDCPPALFAWLVSGAHWDYLTIEYEERARMKIKSLHATGPPDSFAAGLAAELAKKLSPA